METNEVLLDRNTLQKDLRIRLPKQILSNLPVKIGDDENESPEAVAERIQAQKEFEEKKEFTMAFGEGNFGLTKEEVEKAVQELKKE